MANYFFINFLSLKALAVNIILFLPTVSHKFLDSSFLFSLPETTHGWLKNRMNTTANSQEREQKNEEVNYFAVSLFLGGCRYHTYFPSKVETQPKTNGWPRTRNPSVRRLWSQLWM